MKKVLREVCDKENILAFAFAAGSAALILTVYHQNNVLDERASQPCEISSSSWGSEGVPIAHDTPEAILDAARIILSDDRNYYDGSTEALRDAARMTRDIDSRRIISPDQRDFACTLPDGTIGLNLAGREVQSLVIDFMQQNSPVSR